MFALVVIATSIWMAVDASQLGYDKRDLRGLAAMSPAGWLLAGLLLWIVAFPMYLIKRPELKAAGQARKHMLRTGQIAGALYPGQPGYGPMPGAGYGANYQGTPTPGQPPYGHAQHGPQPGAYGQAPGYGAQQGHGSPQGYGQTPQQGYGQANAGADESFDVAEEIRKLNELRISGLLTDAEFQRKKIDLLDRM